MGESREAVRVALFKKHRKDFYKFESRPVREACIIKLMSYVISLEHPLCERVNFVLKHLIIHKGGQLKVKVTDGVLTTQERDVFVKACQNTRICQLRHSATKFVAFLKVDDQEFVKEGLTELEAKTELCTAVLESVSLDGGHDIRKVTDEKVEDYILSTSDIAAINKNINLTIATEKALKQAKLCLIEGSIDISPSKFLNTFIDYNCYTEQVSQNEIQCTIIWKVHRFTAKGNTSFPQISLKKM